MQCHSISTWDSVSEVANVRRPRPKANSPSKCSKRMSQSTPATASCVARWHSHAPWSCATATATSRDVLPAWRTLLSSAALVDLLRASRSTLLLVGAWNATLGPTRASLELEAPPLNATSSSKDNNFHISPQVQLGRECALATIPSKQSTSPMGMLCASGCALYHLWSLDHMARWASPP